MEVARTQYGQCFWQVPVPISSKYPPGFAGSKVAQQVACDRRRRD